MSSHLTGVKNGWYWAHSYNDMQNDWMMHNAQLALFFLVNHGFTRVSASAMVGNMWAESHMSPGCWEEYTDHPIMTRGYGLVQWTGNVRIPDTDPPQYSGMNPYIYWCNYDFDPPLDWENNGYLELKRILYERENNIEFYSRPGTIWPGVGWTTFSNYGADATPETANGYVNDATSMFLYNYLAPADPEATLANRQFHARTVYHSIKTAPLWLLVKAGCDNSKRRMKRQ